MLSQVQNCGVKPFINTEKIDKDTMSTIEKAIALAARKHAGQKDKGQQPYIFHPLRLMFKVKTSEQQIVAVLHDILEDTDTTVVDLISLGFSQEIVDAILALTKKKMNHVSKRLIVL